MKPRTQNQEVNSKPAEVKAANLKVEASRTDPHDKRQDPDDQNFYTFEEFKAKHAEQLAPEEIEARWQVIKPAPLPSPAQSIAEPVAHKKKRADSSSPSSDRQRSRSHGD